MSLFNAAMSFCAIALMRWRSRSMTFCPLPAIGFLLLSGLAQKSRKSARAIGGVSNRIPASRNFPELDHAAKIGRGLGAARVPGVAVACRRTGQPRVQV